MHHFNPCVHNNLFQLKIIDIFSIVQGLHNSDTNTAKMIWSILVYFKGPFGKEKKTVVGVWKYSLRL